MDKFYEAPELKIISFEVNEKIMTDEDPDLGVYDSDIKPF